MPSSGYPMEDLTTGDGTDESVVKAYKHIQDCANEAIKNGLFVEWLESFIGAWNATHNVHIAAEAGCTEWDF